MKIIVTGGAGFIGSAVVRHLIENTSAEVVNVDCLTYAGNLANVEAVASSPRYRFEKLDICDAAGVRQLFEQQRPDRVMHLAAESHVDRSIDGPASFIHTNIIGTYTLLEAARGYWSTLQGDAREQFRFLHVSTDEVYGSLGETGLFTEDTPYDPSSPYSSSKAASDHLVRAWQRTFGLPTLVTNCSNNYGPFQFPEKLIPVIIQNALSGKRLPIYGQGNNVRDWLFVDDHARALCRVLDQGEIGRTYNIGGGNEKQNIEVVRAICTLLDELCPDSPYAPHANLMQFVADRPGHDQRYAIDATRIGAELGWSAAETFESGLRKTVVWYLENQAWCERVLADRYAGERLGLNSKVA